VSDDLKRISKELSELSLVADQTEEKEMLSIDDLADVLKSRLKELGFEAHGVRFRGITDINGLRVLTGSFDEMYFRRLYGTCIKISL
jgi:hypothetical protein